MGGSASREISESKAEQSNGKTVELLSEMCSSWGYGNTKNQVVSQLVKSLNNKGYNVKYTLEPKNGGNGEFYVYKVEDGQSTIVFSNNKKLHESSGAVIGGKITSSNVEAIVIKIVG